MRLHRFYIDQNIEKNQNLRINDQNLIHQWTKVFRFSAGQRVILFDKKGSEFEALFETLSRNEAVLKVESGRINKNKPKIELHIFLALIKKDNFEFAVQKCTELGAKAFHPIIADKSEKKDLNIDRLKKISIEASEQSGRTSLPEIFEPADIETSIKSFSGKLFALDFSGKKISSKIPKIVGVLIGPEGGWSDREITAFKKAGINPLSLGPQVLRAETAAISVSSLILLK